MDLTMALAGALALGIALVTMYLVLMKYTYPAVEEPFFSDPTLFGLFAVGLVEGTILFVVYTYFTWGSIFVAVLFAVLMEVVKLVTLNLKRFHGKSDSIFYGFGLGIGMGGGFAFGTAYYVTAQVSMDAASWVIVLVLIVQTVLLNASTGTTIGEGVARLRPTEYFLQALLISVAVHLLMVPTYISLSGSSLAYYLSYVSMGASLILVIWYFYRTSFQKLPGIVADVLRMEGKKRNDLKR